MTTLEIQRRLKALGLYNGALDGIAGKKTLAAIRGFQRINGLRDDGIVGQKTLAKLFPAPIPEREDHQVLEQASTPSLKWPRQKDCTSFYGKPGNKLCTAGSVMLPAPMRIAWNLNQRVNSFRCHAKVTAPMTRIFAYTFQHYGEKEWRRLGLDLFGGCYNLRQMRGGSAWSMHSWGIAVDLDPEHNQLKWDHTKARFAKPEYSPFWKIVEAEGFVSLGRARDFDWMHLQAARL